MVKHANTQLTQIASVCRALFPVDKSRHPDSNVRDVSTEVIDGVFLTNYGRLVGRSGKGQTFFYSQLYHLLQTCKVDDSITKRLVDGSMLVDFETDVSPPKGLFQNNAFSEIVNQIRATYVRDLHEILNTGGILPKSRMIDV